MRKLDLLILCNFLAFHGIITKPKASVFTGRVGPWILAWGWRFPWETSNCSPN